MAESRKPEITAAALPAPEDRPKADVVLYDGDCPICTGGARLLGRLDFEGRLAFLSLDDPRVRARWPGLAFDALMRELHVVDSLGRVYRGADAVRYLARRLPALWPFLPALYLPGSLPVWRWLYRKLAERRGSAACGDKCRG